MWIFWADVVYTVHALLTAIDYQLTSTVKLVSSRPPSKASSHSSSTERPPSRALAVKNDNIGAKGNIRQLSVVNEQHIL